MSSIYGPSSLGWRQDRVASHPQVFAKIVSIVHSPFLIESFNINLFSYAVLKNIFLDILKLMPQSFKKLLKKCFLVTENTLLILLEYHSPSNESHRKKRLILNEKSQFITSDECLFIEWKVIYQIYKYVSALSKYPWYINCKIILYQLLHNCIAISPMLHFI